MQTLVWFHAMARLPFAAVQTTFTSSEAAVTAWCEWRHPVNSVVWGLVHHFLPPPFAVAVQLSTAVLSAASDAKDTATKRKLYGLETRKGSASRSVAEVPVLAAVHMTELMDEWSSDPVKRLNLKVGQLVKLRVLPVLAAEQVQQELRQQKTKSRSGLPLEASMRLSEVEGTLEGCQEKRKATECKGQHALQFSDLEVSPPSRDSLLLSHVPRVPPSLRRAAWEFVGSWCLVRPGDTVLGRSAPCMQFGRRTFFWEVSPGLSLLGGLSGEKEVCGDA